MTTTEKMNMTPNYDSLPIVERMGFQHLLAKKMLGSDIELKTKEQKTYLEMEWARKYLTNVTKIIDDKKNEEIRALILSTDYEKAAILIIPMLVEKNNLNIAA